jgi:hypothetical protein
MACGWFRTAYVWNWVCGRGYVSQLGRCSTTPLYVRCQTITEVSPFYCRADILVSGEHQSFPSSASHSVSPVTTARIFMRWYPSTEEQDNNFMSDLIPDIRGPKLAPYEGDIHKIELVRLLGPDQSQTRRSGSGSGSAGHSKVFQVNIERKRYVLKIVSFKTHDTARPI